MTTEGKRSYLDPEAVARLGNLSLAARTVVEGFISGLHQSPYKGYSLEFAQHRQYSPGDELRHLDWKVYGRSDRYVIRQFEEETTMRCYIVLDVSASMDFKHAGSLKKIDYALFLTASLAYLMLLQHDAVGLVAVDEQIRHMVPPRSMKGHLNHILDLLQGIKTFPSDDISDSLMELGRKIRKRHLLVIISDLFGQQDRILKAVRYFNFRKNEVIVFHLLDNAERTFPFKGPVRFESLESDEVVLTEPDTIRQAYRKQFEDFLSTYYWGFRQSNIDYMLMETSQPFDQALGEYLTRRYMIR